MKPWLPRRALTACLTLTLALCGALTAHADTDRRAYLTNVVIEGQPAHYPVEEFHCQDRIYFVVEARGLEPGPSELEVFWFNPLGERQETTRHEFYAQPFSRTWAWLQLHGPTGTAIARAFDPSFAMEDFIGEWRVESRIGELRLDEVRFRVLC